MASKRNYTEKEKKEFKALQEEKMKNIKGEIQQMAKKFSADENALAEFMAFSSSFYEYSPRNAMLIHRQNRGARFCDSYMGWKKRGYPVKKGERGLNIFVPVTVTYYKDGPNNQSLIPAWKASEEQKKKLESIQKLHFKIGTVFDVAQTTFPKEKYPELIGPGTDSSLHKKYYNSLVKYSEEKLGVTVKETDFKAVLHRGCFVENKKEIHINEILKDTEKLSVLSHELSHAVLHTKSKKSEVKKEVEADSLSIMIQSRLGLKISDTRKAHLFENFQKYVGEEKGEKDQDKYIIDLIDDVFHQYQEIIPGIEEYTDQKAQNQERKEPSRQTGKKEKKKEKKKNLEVEME